MASGYFSEATFNYLASLAKNNNRDWFSVHKQQYEAVVRNPALDFIADMSYELVKISPHFLAIPKTVGGSLMRIHRDVRFGKDKRPYKTNVGIQFRHVLGKDVHAPGFYVHLEPEGCFVGVGLWRPESPVLRKIRNSIVEKPDSWEKVKKDKKFNQYFSLEGDSLVNPPRGFPKEHPMLIDLKRKDFIAFCPLTDASVCSARFKAQVCQRFNVSVPFMQFLCKSLELNF